MIYAMLLSGLINLNHKSLTMLVKSYAAAVQGISATVITIEVNCTKGIQFFLVGLPDVAVRESHERIISALQVSGYKVPRNPIVVIYPEGRFVV